MSIRKIVTNLHTSTPADTAVFYEEVLGLRVVMNESWIVTLADPNKPAVQLSLIDSDATAPVRPAASIEVSDVDAAYRVAVEAGAEIVYRLTDEEWGVRRFFLKDPAGNVINVLSHR